MKYYTSEEICSFSYITDKDMQRRLANILSRTPGGSMPTAKFIGTQLNSFATRDARKELFNVITSGWLMERLETF